jgi:DnaA-like protein
MRAARCLSEGQEIEAEEEQNKSSEPGGQGAEALSLVRHKMLETAQPEEKVKIASELAAMVYGVVFHHLQERVRSERRLTEARQLGMYIANVCLRVTYEEIAESIGRDRTTVRYGIEKVEERRENPLFDTLLIAIETLVGCLLKKEVAGMIENGLKIDHDLIAFCP